MSRHTRSASCRSACAVDPGFVSRAIDPPWTGRGAQAIPADRVRREERMVGAPLLEKDTVQRERNRQVRSRTDRQMQVGLLREAGASRIDDDEPGTVALSIAQVRDEVNPRRDGIDAPQHDQLCMRVVGVGHTRHLPVETLVGRAGRRRTDRSREP